MVQIQPHSFMCHAHCNCEVGCRTGLHSIRFLRQSAEMIFDATGTAPASSAAAGSRDSFANEGERLQTVESLPVDIRGSVARCAHHEIRTCCCCCCGCSRTAILVWNAIDNDDEFTMHCMGVRSKFRQWQYKTLQSKLVLLAGEPQTHAHSISCADS